MSKGTQVYSIRIPPEDMARVKDFVARNFDRYPNGELSVSKFILDAIRERFGKLDRAKRSGQRTRQRPKDGVIHPPADGPVAPDEGIVAKAASKSHGTRDAEENDNG